MTFYGRRQDTVFFQLVLITNCISMQCIFCMDALTIATLYHLLLFCSELLIGFEQIVFFVFLDGLIFSLVIGLQN